MGILREPTNHQEDGIFLPDLGSCLIKSIVMCCHAGKGTSEGRSRPGDAQCSSLHLAQISHLLTHSNTALNIPGQWKCLLSLMYVA